MQLRYFKAVFPLEAAVTVLIRSYIKNMKIDQKIYQNNAKYGLLTATCF